MTILVGTKENICESAIKLFNDKGFEQVSLREIALHAGTTIGNLTYHYQKKEDLIISIIENLHDEYSFYFKQDLHGFELLSVMFNALKKAQQNEEKYTFYFERMNEFSNNSSHIKKINELFQKELYDFFFNCFITLRNDGLLSKETNDQTIHILVCTFIDILTNWVTISSPFSNPLMKKVEFIDVFTTLVGMNISQEQHHLYQQFIKTLK